MDVTVSSDKQMNTDDGDVVVVQIKQNPASYAHVGVHLSQRVAHGGEVAAEVLDHVLDAPGVFEEVDALSVRVVIH